LINETTVAVTVAVSSSQVMEMKNIYCCKEHVEYGLEEVINESEVPPKLEEVKEQLPTVTCEYCGQLAEYIVSN